MAAKKDFSQQALSIVEQVTGDGPLIDTPEKQQSQIRTLAAPKKNEAAVSLGKLGGMKGGKARAGKLSSERRVEIAKKAAETRWKKS